MPLPKVIRTPDTQFESLPGYDFTPHYVEVDGLRMHYVDEGPENASPILLLHGEPSWSFLYRKMIPLLADEGHRVIAPDLIGFGKSDKLTSTKDYSYAKHIRWMDAFFRHLSLDDVTLFCQDWGGLIGLRVLALHPHRFARVVASNTGLPFASGFKGLIGEYAIRFQVWRTPIPSEELSFKDINLIKWIAYSQKVEVLRIGQVVQRGTLSDLSSEVVNAYDAPFPSEHYKAGARVLPALIPTQLRQNAQVWEQVLSKWEKPFLTAFSDSDPITRGLERMFQHRIPGAHGLEHVTVKDAGHFLQEDKEEEVAKIILDLISSTS